MIKKSEEMETKLIEISKEGGKETEIRRFLKDLREKQYVDEESSDHD